MLALCIIAVLLLLFLILPVGADASYMEGVFTLKAKAGPVRVQILPKKEKKEKKPKPPKEKKEKEKPAIAGKHEEKPKLKLALDDYLALAKIGLGALSRFRRFLSIDVFMFHMAAAAEDPYSAVMQYGYLNAGLSVLSPLLHKAFKIRNEDVRTVVDMEPGKPVIEARVAATLQIWEIFVIAFCAGYAFLRWYLPKRKEAKAAAKAAQPAEQNG